MRMPGGCFGLLLSLLAVAAHVPGAAAQGTGRSMDFDLSLRSAAMGGASTAMTRGGELGHWANPALLGYTRGIRHERSRTQLVPGLATDVWLESEVTKLGFGGVGFVFGGEPAGADGVWLDYGISDLTDPGGNVIGTFSSYERVRSWGFGVNVLEAFESLAHLGGANPGERSRTFDVSAGMNFKRVQIMLAPAAYGGAATAHGNDYGVLARWTPIDGLSSDRQPPVRVDASCGWSVINFTDDTVVFLNEDEASPLTRQHRQGLALQAAAIGAPRDLGGGLRAALVRGFFPLVSASVAADHVNAGGGDAVDYRTNGAGIELAFANAVAMRFGRYSDKVGQIQDWTHGFAVGLPLGTFGGFTYEEAWVPQARNSGLPEVHRRAWAAWFDPFGLAAAMR